VGYIKIKRHRLIKLDKIPFLKEDEEYFIGRKAGRKKRKKAAANREAGLR